MLNLSRKLRESWYEIMQTFCPILGIEAAFLASQPSNRPSHYRDRQYLCWFVFVCIIVYITMMVWWSTYLKCHLPKQLLNVVNLQTSYKFNKYFMYKTQTRLALTYSYCNSVWKNIPNFDQPTQYCDENRSWNHAWKSAHILFSSER